MFDMLQLVVKIIKAQLHQEQFPNKLSVPNLDDKLKHVGHTSGTCNLLRAGAVLAFPVLHLNRRFK